MITKDQYFSNPNTGEVKAHTEEDEARAEDLLARRQALRDEFYAATGRTPDIDPDTGTEISGKKNGTGSGGFRAKGDPTSAGRKSSHEKALGIDDSDQDNAFDDWLTTFDRNDGFENAMLEKHGLYREHPDTTPTWCHLTPRRPGSGRRTFMP
jgi:hypothetical protein